MNHVFISYRHESEEHARAVRRLGDLLRRAKIPVELDQFYLDEHPGGPDEGWPKWYEDRANQSDCVLIIASAGWFAAYEETGEPSIGLGAASEADLFRWYISDEPGADGRIRLVLLHELPADAFPLSLKAWPAFRPFASAGDLDQLIKWLADSLGLHDVQMQWPDPPPDFRPDIANRDLVEWPAIRNMLSGESGTRLLLIEGASGYGKSELLRQSVQYARQLGIPVGRLDFKSNYSDVADVLGQLCADLAENLPNFSRLGGDKMHLLINDLRALRRPVLLVLDTYEKASSVFQDWICENLLPEVGRSPGVVVIIAGQRIPNAEDIRWSGLAQRLVIGPISDPAQWESWFNRKYPKFRERHIDLATLVKASGGVPKTLSDICRLIAEEASQPTT